MTKRGGGSCGILLSGPGLGKPPTDYFPISKEWRVHCCRVLEVNCIYLASIYFPSDDNNASLPLKTYVVLRKPCVILFGLEPFVLTSTSFIHSCTVHNYQLLSCYGTKLDM